MHLAKRRHDRVAHGPVVCRGRGHVGGIFELRKVGVEIGSGRRGKEWKGREWAVPRCAGDYHLDAWFGALIGGLDIFVFADGRAAVFVSPLHFAVSVRTNGAS